MKTLESITRTYVFGSLNITSISIPELSINWIKGFRSRRNLCVAKTDKKK